MSNNIDFRIFKKPIVIVSLVIGTHAYRLLLMSYDYYYDILKCIAKQYYYDNYRYYLIPALKCTSNSKRVHLKKYKCTTVSRGKLYIATLIHSVAYKWRAVRDESP